jgi:hypothetical protein
MYSLPVVIYRGVVLVAYILYHQIVRGNVVGEEAH